MKEQTSKLFDRSTERGVSTIEVALLIGLFTLLVFTAIPYLQTSLVQLDTQTEAVSANWATYPPALLSTP